MKSKKTKTKKPPVIEGRKKFIFASIYLTVNVALLISSFSKARLLEERICSKLFIFVTQVIGWKARQAFTIQMQNVFIPNKCGSRCWYHISSWIACPNLVMGLWRRLGLCLVVIFPLSFYLISLCAQNALKH